MRDAHKKRVRANLSYEDLICLKTELEVNHRELKEIAKRSLFKRKLTITVSDLLPSSEVCDVLCFWHCMQDVHCCLMCDCTYFLFKQEGTTTFFGTNYRARDDLYLMMYEPEIVVCALWLNVLFG